jgi:hypothetical protein
MDGVEEIPTGKRMGIELGATLGIGVEVCNDSTVVG